MTRDRIHVLELRSVRGTGGGPEKTILLGTERATKSRFAVTVCYLRDLRDTVFGIDRRAQAAGLDYVEVRERHSFDRSIWPALKQLVADRDIDIVHSHDYKTSLLGYLLSKRTRIIPLATSHGWTGVSWRERRIYYPVEKRLLARFPRVIAVSSDIRQELIEHGADPARVVVILNGIDPVAFTRRREDAAGLRRDLGFAPGHYVIGAVGRLERQKRFDLLMQAFAPIVRARPECRLVIVGDGSLRADLEAERQRLGLDDVVTLLGHRDDVARLHNALDLYVQSSEYEGTPNTVLEAMALETPIVATDVGGTRELAFPGEHAIIVPAGDVPALRAAIEEVLAAPEAARTRVAAARARIEQVLSFDARNRRLEAIYEDLMREQPGGAAPARAGVSHA
jgi:glycosyltransferase involved in cell wall biosynthesis